jgi:hypothetical protein
MGRRAILVGILLSIPVLGGSASAWAAAYPNGGTPPTTVRVEAATAATVAPAPAPASSGTTLPFTGGDVVTLSAAGLGTTLVGLLLVRRARRTS